MGEQPSTVYEPNQRFRVGMFRSWVVMVRNIIEYRYLIWQIFRRDFLMLYKKSFLGMAWLFIAPIIGVVSWVLMNIVGVLKPGDVGVPYPVYVLIGTSLWGLFMGFQDSAEKTLIAGKGIILQVGYPHEAMLFKQTAQHLANFLFTFVTNIVVLVSFGVPLQWPILLLPILVLPMFLFNAGLGLVRCIIGVVAPDLNKLIGIGMGLLMFVTPIIYAPKVNNPTFQAVLKYNPLTYIVGCPRDLIIYGSYAHWEAYAISVLGSVVLFALCWRVFFLSEQRVIERIL